MKTHLLRCLALLGILLPAVTNRLAAAETSVDSVVARYVEALGGRGALEKLTNSVSKGTASASGMEMQIELFRAAPALQASRVEIPGMGTIRDVYDGKRAWSASPFAGNSEKSGEELAKAVRDAAFHQPLQLKQLFSPLAYKGPENLGTQKVEVLEARLAGGAVERFYFGTANGLLARRDAEVDTSAGRVKTVSVFEDYRAVDGVQQPHRVRMTIEAASQPPMEVDFKLTEIRQNVVLPANAFARPE